MRALSRTWTGPEQSYRDWYRDREHNDFGLGAVQMVHVDGDTWVANMVAKHGIRFQNGTQPIRYNALEECLKTVAQRALDLDASVHMRRIGCGLAGGTWEEVETFISHTLGAHAIRAIVYDLD